MLLLLEIATDSTANLEEESTFCSRNKVDVRGQHASNGVPAHVKRL